jgi:putative MATE family efflux protein
VSRWTAAGALGRGPFDAEIARLALPALGSLAADPLVSLVDTAFVGRLGAEALGGLAVAVTIFNLAFLGFNFLAYGTTPLVAAEVARGRHDEAGRIVMTALALGTAIGVALTVLLQVFTVPVLQLMNAGPGVLGPAEEYLRIRLLALPAVMIITVANGAFRGVHDTRTPFLVTIGLSILNLVLDPLLIFGAGWGIAGAAVATAIAQWAGSLVFLWLMLGPGRHRLGVGVRAPARRALRPLLGAGRALVVRTGALLGTFTFATRVAAGIGTVPVAAHQVAMQVWLFLALVVDALAIAGQAMVGRYLGSDRVGDAAASSRRLLVLGLGAGVVLALLLAAARPFLPGWFTDDPAVVAAVGAVYWFVVLMQPLNALVFVWDGIVIGAAGFSYLAAAMVGSGLVAVTVLAAVDPLGWGLSGVWWGMTALMLARAGSLVWWQVRGPLAAR